MRRRSKISLVIGGIVLLATIAIYLMVRPALFPSTILGLCFLLYSEIVFFGGLALVDMWAEKSSKVLIWAGIAVPLGVYALVVFVSALVFMGAHTSATRGYLIFQIALLVIAVVIGLILGGFSAGARRREERTLEAGRTVQSAIDQLTLIREQTDRRADMDRLIEGLRFSDTSVTVDADVELHDAIATLENLARSDETEEDEFSKAVRGIEFLIQKRNLQVRAAKQGGI